MPSFLCHKFDDSAVLAAPSGRFAQRAPAAAVETVRRRRQRICGGGEGVRRSSEPREIILLRLRIGWIGDWSHFYCNRRRGMQATVEHRIPPPCHEYRRSSHRSLPNSMSLDGSPHFQQGSSSPWPVLHCTLSSGCKDRHASRARAAPSESSWRLLPFS